MCRRVDVDVLEESTKGKQLRVKHFLNRLLGLELVRPCAFSILPKIKDLNPR